MLKQLRVRVRRRSSVMIKGAEVAEEEEEEVRQVALATD